MKAEALPLEVVYLSECDVLPGREQFTDFSLWAWNHDINVLVASLDLLLRCLPG